MCVVAAERVIDVLALPEGERVVGVFFDPVAVGGVAGAAWPAWRAHPLLFPFLHADSGGLLQLSLPAGRRPFWDSTITSIETELTERRADHRRAALAYLTLLLVDLARMTTDVAEDLRRSGEPLLADVFEVIDRRYATPLSLREVADAVGMSAGHLTTVVRRRTGRTVQQWIVERRMAQARVLLADTDLPIGVVAHRVGIPDPGYFSRVFHRHHEMSPRRWRGMSE